MAAPPVVSAPNGFEYDVTRWPIFTTIRIEIPTDEAYRAHLAVMDSVLARDEVQVHVVDILATGASRDQMRAQAAWNDRHRKLLEARCLGVGMVLHSTMQRFGIAAMLTLTKQPVPYQVFATRESAVGWASEQLLRHKRKSPRA